MTELFGMFVLLCVGFIGGWFVYNQYDMLRDRHYRQKMRKELDRLFKD